MEHWLLAHPRNRAPLAELVDPMGPFLLVLAWGLADPMDPRLLVLAWDFVDPRDPHPPVVVLAWVVLELEDAEVHQRLTYPKGPVPFLPEGPLAVLANRHLRTKQPQNHWDRIDRDDSCGGRTWDGKKGERQTNVREMK